MNYSALIPRLTRRKHRWSKGLTRVSLGHSKLVTAFMIVFISQLLVMIQDPDPSQDGSDCDLYGLVIAHRLFCNPLSKIGGALALTLPGFPILIGAIETAGGHHSAGLIRIYALMVNFIALSCAISMGWYFGGIINWKATPELDLGLSHPNYLNLIPQLNGTGSHEIHLRPNDEEPENARAHPKLFASPPKADWYNFGYAMGFLIFSIPTFNGIVFSRKTLFHKRFIRHVVVASGSLAVRTAFIHYFPRYKHLPLQLRSIVDGILIGIITMLTALLGGLVPPYVIRRPHAAVTYPAMFLMLPFAALLPFFESIGDQKVYDFEMSQKDQIQLGRFYLEVFWSMGTSVGGLVVGLVLFGGTVFRTY